MMPHYGRAMSGLLIAGALLVLSACADTSDGRSFERAEAAIATGDYATARIELLNAARERPGDAAVQLATAETLLELGDAVGGEAAAREAGRLGADAATVAALIGDAAVMRGDPAAADAAAATLPLMRTADRARLTGGAAMVRGDYPAAAALFQAGLAAMPDDARLHIELGHALRLSGNLDDAAIHARRATTLAPRRAGGPLLTAQIAEARRNPRAALAGYDAALAAQPRNIAAMLGRASMLAELGRTADVEAMIPGITEVAPNHPQLAFLKASVAAAGGRAAEAHSLLGGVGDRLDTHLGATALASDVALKLGYTSLAVSKARQAHAMASGEPYLNYLLANALWHDGQMTEAAAVMRFFDDATAVPAPARDLQRALATGRAAPRVRQ